MVTTRREGTRIHYKLAGDDVAQLYSRVRAVAQEAHLSDVESARLAYLGLEPGGPDPSGEITREQLLAPAESGAVTVLDVRPKQEYRAAHIPGAVSIPLEELGDRLSELSPDREIVAYCRGAYWVLAHEAIALLKGRGLRATRLHEGMLEWRLASLPVSSEAAA